MLIEVTQEDIDQGVRGSYGLCPVALASTREGLESIRIGESYLSYKLGVATTYCPLPYVVQEFIESFDKDIEVKPFSFEIRSE